MTGVQTCALPISVEGIAHIDEGNAEKGDMTEPDHPSAPGMITAQPVFSVEKETEHCTRDKPEQDADPGGVINAISKSKESEWL